MTPRGPSAPWQTDARSSPDDTLERWARERAAPLAPGFVAARLERERRKAAGHARVAASPLLRRRSPHHVVPRALALAGLANRARRNALAVTLTRRVLALPSLPPAFDGFRLLHVSDPHFGADPILDDAVVESVAGIEHDLCVMTGDYRYRSFGPIGTAIDNVARLREALGTSADREAPLAVLGNHDSIEMAPPMEALGIRVLLNERVAIRRGDATLHVAGVDDPRYYRLDDVPRALAPVPGEQAVILLLAHSPERADAAAALGCDAYLCGHTHGGQICLPGGRVLARNARAPRERLSGAWRVGAMRGYTSRGAGVSIAVARFGCPPEITLHELRRAR